MSLLELIILAFGLSMDSFAVSIANGIINPELKFKKALFIAFIMGGFHILMPVLGYYFAQFVSDIVKEIDHWVAFVLLLIIGGKMIMESLNSNHENADEYNSDFNLTQVFTQSFATSIDAFAIGVTLGFLQIHILKSSLIVGLVTFIMVMIGLKAGILIGSRLGKKMEFIGGLILILIGLKILLEHISLS